MTYRDVEAWLFGPPGDVLTNQIWRIVEAECRARGWSAVLRPIRKRRTSEGRPLGPISNEDATNLYRRIHRVRVGVWEIGRARAPIKPSPRPVVNDYVELRSFVRHKAFHRRLSTAGFDAEWPLSLAAFEAWLQQVSCEGEGDPRCLPLHVFGTDFKIDRLGTAGGREEFARAHGPQSARRDSNGLLWNRPKGAFHGRETLHIAGRDLATGFHWDVSSGGRMRRITTTRGVWDIDPDRHVNVYPDQHVRGREIRAAKRRRTLNRRRKAR